MIRILGRCFGLFVSLTFLTIPVAYAQRPLALNWNNVHTHQRHWQPDYVWTQPRCMAYRTTHPDFLILGDSIFDGWNGYLLHEFPGALVDAKVSRQFSTGVQDYANLLQYRGIRSIRTVAVELGTNGPIQKSQIRRFMTLVGHRMVIWITPSVPRPWQDEVLTSIDWAAHRYPNIRLVHWHALAAGHPQWFRGGQVHPNWSGIQQEVSALKRVYASLR